MRAHTKLKIDRWIGGPLCWGLNLAARCMGFVLQRDHRLPPAEAQGICVAKYTGMGSILSALPLLAALKERYPDARLVFISSSKNAALLERMAGIDERLYVNEESLGLVMLSTLRLCLHLWRLRPALYIDLELYSYYASLVSVLSCARNRLGFYRKSAVFKKGLFTHLVFFNTFAPVHELYSQLGYIAGCHAAQPRAESESKVQLRIQPQDRDEVQSALSTRGGCSAPLLVVNPNASDLCLERRWPLTHFAAAIAALLEQIPNLTVALTGTPAEREYVTSLQSPLAQYEQRVINVAGQLSLGGLLALLERADCILTNDSGPMHMAVTLKRPTVALFGPVHPQHYAMLANRARTVIFYERVICSPCVHHSDMPPCGGDNQCMKLIRADGVVKACLAFLSCEGQKQARFPQQWLPLMA
jgi:lipopolysaccharide heptosyltransferase II